MKITFIGSSHGVPEPHRKCTCIMLEVGENVYFIDMGTSAIDALRTRNISPDPVICLPLPEAGKVINDWLKVTLNGAEKEINYKETQPGVVYDDGVLKVTAVATQHCYKSFSYIVEAEGKTVLFTGDLKNPGIDFPAPAMEKPLDLVVCESAHFPATDYIPVFEKCDIKKVCVTHYSDRFLASVLTLCETLKGKGLPAVRTTDDFELTV